MIKYPKRISEMLTKEEIAEWNMAHYGKDENPWADNPSMADYVDKLVYIRHAIVAKALGIDFDEVSFGGDGDFFKAHFDKIPTMTKEEIKKHFTMRENPNRFITSYMWGYDQTNVEIAEHIGAFNGLPVFIKKVGKWHDIFFSRIQDRGCEFPTVRENSSISYPYNPRTYKECFEHYAKHDDPYNGYYR